MDKLLSLLFILIFLQNFLFIKCQACNLVTKKVNLVFHQYLETSPNKIIHMTTSAIILSKYQANEIYILTGNRTTNNTLRIVYIRYTRITSNSDECSKYCQDLFISLQHIFNDDCVVKLEEKDSKIKAMLRVLYVNQYSTIMNLTCTLDRIYDNSRESDRTSSLDTNLFNMIFLSSFFGLTCIFCFGWFTFKYYRRFIRHRRKKREQKELEHCVQKILENSPIIIFNLRNKEQNFLDDDSICAICLESFTQNEKIRKLICSHYFHLTCIDPWLLAHQNCPLCNRNILNDSIPSISAQIA